jgi:hypothetical protein
MRIPLLRRLIKREWGRGRIASIVDINHHDPFAERF